MSTSLPLVSVITVTYNAEQELEETILSIIQQSYPNVEFLLIDGGSTDKTLHIIEKYKDRIDFFISEKDEGIYDAMNKGIRHAKGEWLNFMNAGDSFASLDVLEQLSEHFSVTKTDIICGDRYLLQNGKKTLQKAKGTRDFWVKGSPCFHQSMFIRKRAIADKGYSRCYKLSSDYEFMVRSVVEKKVFEFVDLPISNFLEGGASKQQVIRSQIEAIKVLLDYTSDETIIKNNIFFQGLIRQNALNEKSTEKNVKQKEKSIGVKPELIRAVQPQQPTGRKILIIDPIFRGSRLFYSWLVASSYAKRGYQVDIISRSHAITEQYHEHFDDVPHNLYDGITVPKDFWFGILTQVNVQEVLERVRYLEQENQYDFIYFAGLNEHYPNLFSYLEHNRMDILVNKKMLFIEYDVRHLVKDKVYLEFNNLKNLMSSLKSTLSSKRYSKQRETLVFSFLKHYPQSYIGILDERIDSKVFSKIIKHSAYKHFFYLPDPSPEIVYKPQNDLSGPTKVLIVGLQNRRKGMNQLVEYLKRYDKQNKIAFVFVGKLTEETEQYREFLTNNRHIQWYEGYFPEEEIQRFYAEADYIFLPYTPDFTASSGVLAYATSFTKPVVSTDHGLIGYKVKHYKLGYRYRYNVFSELFDIFSNLPKRETKAYKQMSDASRSYAKKHSIAEHQKIITKVLDND